MAGRRLAAFAGALLLTLPAWALGAGVTGDATTVTVAPDGFSALGNEAVNFNTDGGFLNVTSDRGISAAVTTCIPVDPTTATCLPVPALVVQLGAFDDNVSADNLVGAFSIVARGGVGSDRLTGTNNNDHLFGEDGIDTLAGLAGNDILDGGNGENVYEDGAGDDIITGGPNDDSLNAGTGRDLFTAGAGEDNVSYRSRGNPVSVTLDGVADDGEAGEGDQVGTDVENVFGGAGNDRLIAGPVGVRLAGGAGNDELRGSPAEDRIEGNEGDDVIDTRDGRFDSVDCGPGTDTLFADPGDTGENCEVSPDRDGDGFLNEADCQPDNAGVNPGAGEVPGNTVDEDCVGGPLYLRAEGTLTVSVQGARRPPPARVRFAILRLSDVRARAQVQIRCSGGGCPFATQRFTATGVRRINLLPRLRGRSLIRNAVLEIRISRPLFQARVFRLRVTTKADVVLTRLCLSPGQRVPRRCN